VIVNDGVTLVELEAQVGQRWSELRERFGL